jgi:hypothetical protein
MIPQTIYDYNRLRDMAANYIEHCQMQINSIEKKPGKFQDQEIKARYIGARNWAYQFYNDLKQQFSYLAEEIAA